MNEQSGRDLRVRTKSFALRIIRLYASLPKTVEAQVIGKQKDDALAGYHLVVDGSHYRLRCTLIVHDWRAWAVYAGTVRSAPILENELELAEKARDDTKVGSQAMP